MLSLRVLVLVICSTFCYRPVTGSVNQHLPNLNIPCCKELLLNEKIILSVANSWKTVPAKPKGILVQLLLILSGHVEVNPGPTIKFPCGECKKAVHFGRSIACDSCNQWFHANCLDMNSQIFDSLANSSLSWECCNCGLRNISFSVFDSSISSNDTTNSPKHASSPITKKKPKQLRIFVVNFQSIWGKKEELEVVLQNDIDIVIGSETHLDPSISDHEFIPHSYTCYRRDRKDAKGGVIIIVKNELITEQILTSKTSEVLAIKIQTHSKPLIIVACYRPTNNKLEEAKNICEELSKLSNKYKNCPLWFGGDINLPDIDWKNYSVVNHQYSKLINETFIETFENCNLDQIVHFPTRVNNTLDILATNRPTLVNRCVPQPGLSDHDTTILADINCYAKKSKPVKRVIHITLKNMCHHLLSHFLTIIPLPLLLN